MIYLEGWMKMNNELLTTFNGTPIEDIIRKLPAINKIINDENIKIFQEHGTYNSSDLRHKCVLCEKIVDIDGSVSSIGNKLICIPCVHKYFEGDYAAVFMWNKNPMKEGK